MNEYVVVGLSALFLAGIAGLLIRKSIKRSKECEGGCSCCGTKSSCKSPDKK